MQRRFHLSLSVAHSSLIFQASRSLLTVSYHHNFGLPLGRFPSIFISATARMFSVSYLLLTCTNHSILLRLITVAIGSTFASSKIFSFHLCYNRLTPLHHYIVAIHVSSLTDIGHVSHFRLPMHPIVTPSSIFHVLFFPILLSVTLRTILCAVGISELPFYSLECGVNDVLHIYHLCGVF